MSKNQTNQSPAARPLVRCAIYTRKSTEEGLEQEFNSLDAQREAAQAYITSQQHAGWACLPQPYDDGGYTGGNMDRPALAQLLADIAQGQIDCVIVYKVDRLSRSLLDFARMMETFEQHGVTFVSVTQQFNTATSMGRLVLNVLLSFAQFEREIIAERTRDKIAAARRKGKWSGGMPLLGYDVDPHGSKLVIQAAEAKRVRAIFRLYREHEALLPVVRELERRGWVNKQWLTRKGRTRGGQRFTKTSLYRLLTHVAYVGKIKYRGEIHDGEHAGIVELELWQQVQELLRQHGPGCRGEPHISSWALLKGLLRCRPCGCVMTPTFTVRGCKRYRYYVCDHAQKRGRDVCPSQSIAATELERLIVQQLQAFACDPQFPEAERAAIASVADPVAWQALPTEKQALALRRVLERVDYDGDQGKVSLTLRQAPEAQP